MSDTCIQIDGSYGEGGGQIIRTSLSLSALTGKPVTIMNVRAKRSKPGLQPQHLMAVEAAARICEAGLDGAAVGSQGFTFTPTSAPRHGDYRFDIGTAGATTLVMQTVLLPLSTCAQRSMVTVCGGTHVPHAPTGEYLDRVYGAFLRAHGLDAGFVFPSAGFYPRGGGEVNATVGPSRLTPVELALRGRLQALTVYVVTSGLPDHVAARGVSAAQKALTGFREPRAVVQDLPSRGQGAAVVVVAECDNIVTGFSAVGERGKPMEQVAQEACKQFATWYRSEAACDEHLADQLVLPMALIPHTSFWTTSGVTEHLRTVLWVVQQFLDVAATVEVGSDGTGLVTVSGVALKT